LLFLGRAAESVKAAAPEGTEWIIVNDGGDAAAAEAFVEALQPMPGLHIRLITTEHQGRGGAANTGLAHARGAFFHLHDDDDTVEPDFYHETIAFLEKAERFGGVCTLTARIEEEIGDGKIRQLSRAPHNPDLTAVTFAKLATAFLFPPIGFLARTSCCRAVGEFETAPDIPEDYDFDLRFLEKFDIGVIRRELSFVHQRRGSQDRGPADWVHAPASLEYQTYNAALRNKYFRRDLQNGTVGLGWLLALGEMAEPARKIDILLKVLGNNRALRWVSGKLR
jgi:glycosyltransferase involved in cell wall biosynthesis